MNWNGIWSATLQTLQVFLSCFPLFFSLKKQKSKNSSVLKTIENKNYEKKIQIPNKLNSCCKSCWTQNCRQKIWVCDKKKFVIYFLCCFDLEEEEENIRETETEKEQFSKRKKYFETFSNINRWIEKFRVSFLNFFGDKKLQGVPSRKWLFYEWMKVVIMEMCYLEDLHSQQSSGGPVGWMESIRCRRDVADGDDDDSGLQEHCVVLYCFWESHWISYSIGFFACDLRNSRSVSE